MKTLTIFIFSVLIVFSIFMLMVSTGVIVALQNPNSSEYHLAKEEMQKPGALAKSIEEVIKGSVIVVFCTAVYLIGCVGILFFKEWARYLIIISPLIWLISDVIISPVMAACSQHTTIWDMISFYIILSLPSLFLFLPKVKKQFMEREDKGLK